MTDLTWLWICGTLQNVTFPSNVHFCKMAYTLLIYYKVPKQHGNVYLVTLHFNIVQWRQRFIILLSRTRWISATQYYPTRYTWPCCFGTWWRVTFQVYATVLFSSNVYALFLDEHNRMVRCAIKVVALLFILFFIYYKGIKMDHIREAEKKFFIHYEKKVH